MKGGSPTDSGSRASRWCRAPLRALFHVLLPPLCPLCRVREAEGAPAAPFCGRCRSRLQPLAEPFCPSCAVPYPGAGPSHPCPRCRADPPPFFELRAWGPYQGALLEAVRRWKFGRDPCMRAAVEGLAREALVRFWSGVTFGAVVPVPCHPSTLRRRGAGLPALLARAVAREAGAPWRPTALEKARAVPELVGLDAQGRAAAVKGAYRPTEPLGGAVLLVDDVATSTATARACAEACREAGALRVCVLALARTPLHGPSRTAEEEVF